MEALIILYVSKYPAIIAIASVMGFARMILKPLMVFLHEYVNITKSDRDNELLRKIESHKVYKLLLFALDYVFSLKLKK